jgi:hypothetical protein
MRANHGVVILIAPPSYHFYENRFFILEGPLNRDNTLRANAELRECLQQAGYPVFTADQYDVVAEQYPDAEIHYWSFGAPSAEVLSFNRPNVRKVGVALFEPPLVKPADYENISALTRTFERVYLHNTTSDGYQVDENLQTNRLYRLDWTNRHFQPDDQDQSRIPRLNRVAMIAGAHFRRARADNGYGLRLQALLERGLGGPLDLYGNGWGRLQLRSPMASCYWYMKLRLADIQVSAPTNKSDVYGRYNFALCYENMAMSGYITEKIFDALFSECIPIYWGAPDVSDFIPADCFVDRRQFSTCAEAIEHCIVMPDSDREAHRAAIGRFLKSKSFRRFDRGFHGEVKRFYLGGIVDAG